MVLESCIREVDKEMLDGIMHCLSICLQGTHRLCVRFLVCVKSTRCYGVTRHLNKISRCTPLDEDDGDHDGDHGFPLFWITISRCKSEDQMVGRQD